MPEQEEAPPATAEVTASAPAPSPARPTVVYSLAALGLLAAAGMVVFWWATGREQNKFLIVGGVLGLIALLAIETLRRSPAQALEAERVLRRLGPAGLLGVFWSSAPAIFGFVLLANIGPLSEWLKASPALGLAGYIAVFIVSAGLGLLPTYAQAILGGWVFGPIYGFWVATLAALAGFAGASLIGYFVARSVSQDRVESVIRDHPKWEAVRQALIRHGFWRTLGIVALVRVPPNSPFALTNLVLSTTGVRLPAYVLGTAIGMTPRTALAVWLATKAAAEAPDIQTFVKEGPGGWVLIGGLVAMMIVLGVIGAIANRAIERVVGTQPAASGAD